MTTKLVFLKLGGSLITVKDQPHTPRPDVLVRLAQEIAQARSLDPDLQLLLGHGSGSYGHVAASRYNTHLGVKTLAEWAGFADVWWQAAELNHLLMAALAQAHLPAIAFSPSAMVTTRNRQIETWDLGPLQAAINQNLLPVVYGDVVFDQQLGGTVLSTEDLFSYLARQFRPIRLLFAGLEPGVYADYTAHDQLLPQITPHSFVQAEMGLKGSSATDVTGGMLDKVRQVVALVSEVPGLQGMIFSGDTPGNLKRALLGETLGTRILQAGGSDPPV